MSKEKTDLIISLDLEGLRQGLVKGKFTSVDLVNVFGARAQTIARELELSAEENFTEALKMAAVKDSEL